MEDNNKMIEARVIIEMAGVPKEHIEKTMELLIQKIDKDDNVKLIGSEISDAIEKDGMWSLFSEMEIEVKDVPALLGFCFDYMPSSVEIMEPGKLSFESSGFSGLINDMQARLHQVDMVLKGVNAENRLLKKNGTLLLHNLVTVILKAGKRNLDDLVTGTGIPGEQLKKFLDILVKDGKLNEEDGRYSLQR